MKPKKTRTALAVLMMVGLAQMPWAEVVAENAALGKVLPRRAAELNQTPLVAETTLYGGDTVVTRADGLALIYLSRGDQVHVGPASEVRVLEADGTVLVSLERGRLLARVENEESFLVRARGLLVRPAAEARYQVALAENGVVVASEQGQVSVQGANRAYTVPEGQAMRFEVTTASAVPTGAASGGQGIGPGAAAAIAVAISVGIAIPVAWLIADKRAEEACEDAINAISPGASTANCD